ncbi:MAG: AAA family ATPase, partial [Eubacterium sp.]|nr:AAA family ATPase [Eubacterium sp.]
MSTQKGTLINKYTPNYVIFDLETTGISPNYDEVIEISALKVKGGEVVDEFNTLVNPGRKIPFGATKVNGITNAMVAEAPAFSHVLEEFLDFAEGLVLVGHNIARFDMKFIWRDTEQYFGEIPQNNYVDTLQVARKHLPKMEHHRLVDLAEHYGISSEGAHRALNDCYMNQKVYECMVAEMREAHQKRVEEARKKASEDVEVQQRPQHFTVKIRGVVERITYQNPENGYTVLKCAVKSYKELVTVIGSLLDVNVGSVLLIYGNWKVDSRYGRQFAAESWEETLPATVFGIEKYLGSGLIKGVGPKYAKKIVAQFGIETLEVIETDISRLQEVDGIGKKRIQMIRDSWERQKEIKNVMLFLQDHGVSTSFAAKIYRQYGNESLDKMKENPFQMADDIWGIGFKTADGIAQKLGFAKEAYVRLRSGIMYTLSNLADEGHVFAYQEQLIAKAAELLEAEESSIVMTLDQMIADKDLICETVDYKTDQAEMKAIYLPAFYYAEAGVAGKLKRLAQAPAADRLWHALVDARQQTGNESLSIDVSKIQEKVHMEYDEIQADAIRKAAVSKVMVLTGGPGTGKTTTTQGIIAAYRSFGLKILLAAPTGRAAKRMTEATGLEAKTIHRLLECKPPEGYQKNEDNPLDGDVLIIDECSMIDMILMNALLKAIPEGMRLILVGDIDQLPSVGAGNVLRDIIDSGVFPVVRLTRIFRQAQSSRNIMNAHAINEGKFPDISNGKNKDFFFIEKKNT